MDYLLYFILVFQLIQTTCIIVGLYKLYTMSSYPMNTMPTIVENIVGAICKYANHKQNSGNVHVQTIIGDKVPSVKPTIYDEQMMYKK